MKKSTGLFNSNKFIITVMSLFIITILILAVTALTQDKNKEKEPSVKTTPSASPTEAAENKNEGNMLVVIREIDSELYVMSLTDADTGETSMYTYTAATDVRDKYGKVLSAKQLNKGEMADIVYDTVSNRISKIQISSDVWEYNGLNSLLFNTKKKVITFLGDRYYYDDGILVLDGSLETDLDGFIKKDVFTIRGYGYKICSVTLTRGHGYLKLMDAESFVGGNIYIGNGIWEQVIDDMVLAVPEGEYDVRIEFGKYEGTETVKIVRHETSTFYAGGYGPLAESVGRVYFDIYPYGANLYIDNILHNYADSVEITYGLHNIEVNLGGYRTYSGSITVDRTESSYSVTLSPTSPDDENTIGGNIDENIDGNTNEPNNNIATITGAPDNTSELTNITPAPDNTSEQGNKVDSGSNNKVTNENTMTIYYANNTEVYIDGTYVGDIANGKLVISKHIGLIEIDLYNEERGIVNHTLEIEDDGEDYEITIPQF